jgi:hypothetical protein
MNRNRWLVSVVSLVAALSLSSAASAGLTDSLTGAGLDSLLGKQLGLTADQSKGGIGAILGMAKEKLSPDDYAKVASAIPGADKYVSKAKSLGLLDKPIKDKSGLDGAFSKLGIPQDKADKMVPTVTDLVGQVGGDQAKSLLSGALK